MKLSKRFNLSKTQFELDFVDIDTDIDTRLFVDPYLLGLRPDRWSIKASNSVRSFFAHFLDLVRQGKEREAFELFSHLHEPNETCLGLSSGKPRGNGIGSEDAKKLFESIMGSKAIRSGKITDLEDFRLFIPGIGKDKVSDMTTNLIREGLIAYTQAQCKLHGIPLTPGVSAGPIWDASRKKWTFSHEDTLLVEGKKILLTPKGIVSYSKAYAPENYYNKHVLEYLQHEHIKIGSILVEHRKDGTPFVSKKSLKANVVKDFSKEWLFEFTEKHPLVFQSFRDQQAVQVKPLTSDSIDSELNLNLVVNHLIARLNTIKQGAANASEYHKTIVGVLEMLFYPNASSPVLEAKINNGRKRIDIYFENSAKEGFFYNLHMIHKIACPFIMIECKNYSKDIENPELDQMIGRLTVNRGMLGIITCRNIIKKDLFIERCRDTFRNGHGLIIPITDDDFIFALEALKSEIKTPLENILNGVKNRIIMS
jgi:hypothetical protein